MHKNNPHGHCSIAFPGKQHWLAATAAHADKNMIEGSIPYVLPALRSPPMQIARNWNSEWKRRRKKAKIVRCCTCKT
jgi:hypothetical protein